MPLSRGVPMPPVGTDSAGYGDDYLRDLAAFLNTYMARVDDAALGDSRAPAGPAGGALAGTYPNPTLAATVQAMMFETGDLCWSFKSSKAGWLPFDGSSYLTADYAVLSSIVRPIFGGVDGSHFTLPNLKGRAPVVAGTGPSLTARALGALFGTETHQLTVAQLPVHTHQEIGRKPGGTPPNQINGLAIDGSSDGLFGTPDVTGTAGSDQAHPNVQPSFAANLFIKT